MSGSIPSSNPVSSESNGCGVFNPFSPEFKEAEELFHRELSCAWWRQALVVIASVVGGLFFIVGAFPVFCWTVQALKPGENKSADQVTQATGNLFSEKRKEEGVTITQARVSQQTVPIKQGEELKREEEKKEGDATAVVKRDSGVESPPGKVVPVKAVEEIFNPVPFSKVDEIAFGKSHWEKYFGDVGQEPDLPSNIEEILMADCKIFPGKRVWETHMLVLIPEKVDSAPLTVESIGELAERLKLDNGGYACKYRRFSEEEVPEKIKTASVKSHWALITKEMIPGSGGKSCAKQKEIVEEIALKTGIPYKVPHLRDLAVCLFMHRAAKGKGLLSSDEKIEHRFPFGVTHRGRWRDYTYTRCKEVFEDAKPIVIGGFDFSGLAIFRHFQIECVGMAASWKL